MDDSPLTNVLRAGSTPPPAADLPPRLGVLLAGGGGPLGSALLEALLGRRRFAPLRVLVERPLAPALPGLATLAREDFERGAAPGESTTPLGLVVLDRERHANGREAAFTRPAPADLPGLAQGLLRHGVRHLVVVMPHHAASLPPALAAGLATVDEQAVAALGFAHVVLVRPAQAPAAARSRGLQRIADLLLAQLRLMTPPQQLPVRAAKVAAFVAALAARLPQTAPGTRVVAPEWVWLAAQADDVEALAERWLAGDTLPPLQAPRRRY